MTQIKKDTWYKVYYTEELYNGEKVKTFAYTMNEQVAELEKQFKGEGTYIETKEWVIGKEG